MPEMEFRQLALFNAGHVGVFWCTAGISPWERHPDDEELLQVVEGEVDLEVLTDDGPVVKNAPGPSEMSTAADPRTEGSDDER